MKRQRAVTTVVSFLAMTALMAAGADAAKDWPQWRGPKRDGVSTETGLLKQWPAGGPQRLRDKSPQPALWDQAARQR